MSALEILSRPLAQQITWTLLHFVWQGAAVALLLAVALALLRSAPQRYAAALVALLALLAAPVATFPLLGEGEQPRAAAPLNLPLLPLEADADTAAVALAAAPRPALPPAQDWLLALQPYMLLVWLTGLALFGIRLVGSYGGLRRLRREAQPVSGELLLVAQRLARRLNWRGEVRLAWSRHAADALAVGLWRPLVILPAAWLGELPPAVLEAVIAHELAHIRRGDLWVNLLQRVAETALFYHPAVWYVSRMLREEREKCCDEAAVRATGARVAYVEALELVARRRLAASPALWAAAMGGQKNMNLLERVRNVLGVRPATSAARYWPVGLAALAAPAGICWAALALAPTLATADDEEEKEERPAAVQREREEREREERAPEAREREAKEGDRARHEAELRAHKERVAARLAELKLPEGERERAEWFRRASLDLLGRGPTDAEHDTFMRSEGPELKRFLITHFTQAPRDRPREGGERPDRPREGDRPPPREGGDRPDRPREGDRPPPPREGADRPREGDRPPPPREGGRGPANEDLVRIIMQLREEVNALRAEVRELRSRGGGPRPDAPRPDGPPRREGEPRRDGEPRREGDRPAPDRERPDAPRGDRERPDVPRGDRERPDGPRVER